jgi:hypothetical protein
MFGDGWVTINRRRNLDRKRAKRYATTSFVTCVAQSVYPDLDARVQDAFDECFEVRPKATRFGYCRTEVARVGRWFLEHGLTGNAHTKRVLSWVFGSPIAVRRSFIEGLADADGYVNARGRFAVKLCNRPLCEDLRNLVRSCGMAPSNLYEKWRMQQAPNSPAPKMSYICSVAWQPTTTDQEFGLATVRSVEPAGRAEVFDLQVEDAECFIADGLVSHNTRWHEDDLVGRLLRDAEHGGEQWDVLCLPAFAEDGDMLDRPADEALWPERFDTAALERIRTAVGSYVWNALYQQRPAPAEGGMFKRNWWRFWRVLPEPGLFTVRTGARL